MTQLVNFHIAICLLLLVLWHVIVEGNAVSKKMVQQNVEDGLSSSSPWLEKITNHHHQRLRDPGCWKRPWICKQGEVPGIRLCCRNLCVDVSSDVNNCGSCGTRCPFSWQCCRAQCVNTNINPFHCGKCGNRCSVHVLCFYGMCGYGGPLPSPFPPPRPPHPPFPSPPKLPRSHPPQPPQPPRGSPPTMQ
ncbi:hypothetical protein I3843_11G188600 [Carya illinoinensis]|nr:hypothetical protein I3843_11G188600 [Carya illinoinensis]